MDNSQLKIGLFGIGLEAYWKQFDGLKERLEGYLSEVHKRLCDIHEGIVNPGLIDTVEKAFEAGKKFRTEDVDLIFYMSPRMLYHQQCCPWYKEQKFR
jgi:L-arabinose isomerase